MVQPSPEAPAAPSLPPRQERGAGEEDMDLAQAHEAPPQEKAEEKEAPLDIDALLEAELERQARVLATPPGEEEDLDLARPLKADEGASPSPAGGQKG